MAFNGMNLLKIGLLELMLIITLPPIVSSAGNVRYAINYSKQMDMIVLFYKITTEKPIPTVEDFNTLFGKDNEAEVQIILRKKYPLLNWKGNWFDNQDALNFIKKVDANPKNYQSIFLQCIKSADPKLFAEKVKRQIEFPPDITSDFTEFTVMTGINKITFTFSQDESFIEDVLLQNGQSIYSLIDKCVQ